MVPHVPRLSPLIAVLAVAAVLVPVAGAGTRQTVQPTLYVEYAMNCTFAIHDDDGRRITSIAPGTYQIHVRTPVVFATVDLTGIFDMTACKGAVDFRLTGPGVNVITTLQDGDEDKDDFRETFQPGSTYVAQDQNQPAVARLVFSTTASGSPTAPAHPSPPSPSASGPGSPSKDIVGSAVKASVTPTRGALSASVSAAGTLKLVYKGKAVGGSLGSLKGGRYTATVTDASKKAGFVLQQLGKNGVVVKSLTVTNVPFVGKRTATVSLEKGQWVFTPSGSGKKTFFVVVG
jgi:hypothetical protein